MAPGAKHSVALDGGDAPEALEIGVAAELDGRTLGDGQFDRHLDDVVDLDVGRAAHRALAQVRTNVPTPGAARTRSGEVARDEQDANTLLGENGQRRFEADNAAMGPGCSLTQILDKRGFAIPLGALGDNACRASDLLHGRGQADASASEDQLSSGRVHAPLQFGDSVVGPTDHNLADLPLPHRVVDFGGGRPQMDEGNLLVVPLEAAELDRGVDGSLLPSDDCRKLVDVTTQDAEEAQVGAVDEGKEERLGFVVRLRKLTDARRRSNDYLVADRHRRGRSLRTSLGRDTRTWRARASWSGRCRGPATARIAVEVALDGAEDLAVLSGVREVPHIVGKPLERPLVVGPTGR